MPFDSSLSVSYLTRIQELLNPLTRVFYFCQLISQQAHYRGTTALDISELDYLEFELNHQIYLDSRCAIAVGGRQVIPFRIVRSESREAATDGAGDGGGSNGSSDGGDGGGTTGWGGLMVYARLTYQL